MSLRDDPDSHKLVVPLVAGLSLKRAYSPTYGGIGGPGNDRLTLDESWVTRPGVDNPLCNGDPRTDAFLVLWLDATVEESLILADPVIDPISGRPFQQKVLEWRDLSGKGNHGRARSLEYAPKLARNAPFFARSVDMTPVCLEPGTEPDPE